jgi:hypothetical protein
MSNESYENTKPLTIREAVDSLFAIALKPVDFIAHKLHLERHHDALPPMELSYHAPQPYYANSSAPQSDVTQGEVNRRSLMDDAKTHGELARALTAPIPHGKFAPDMPVHGVIPEHLRKPLVVAALRLAGERVTQHNIAAVEARVSREDSSWHTDILNTWDINARKGTPSCGPLQIIGPTFEANKVPGHDDLHNPLDSMAAAIKYARCRYGGIDKVAWRDGGY